jgi:hypothetical protein
MIMKDFPSYTGFFLHDERFHGFAAVARVVPEPGGAVFTASAVSAGALSP